MLASGDFETYSEAGNAWDSRSGKFVGPNGDTEFKKRGLPMVGAANYAQHPSTEVTVFYYRLPGHTAKTQWRPGMPNPTELFSAPGMQAWNSGFEYWIWNYVCTRRYGWPAKPIEWFVCDMAKARAHALPGKLELAAQVTGVESQKRVSGSDLIKTFGVPRNPTKGDPRTRIFPLWTVEEYQAQYQALCAMGVKPAAAKKLVDSDWENTLEYARYCEDDVSAEDAVAEVCPRLLPLEARNWRYDQIINRRGVAGDREGIDQCIQMLEMAVAKYEPVMWQLCQCRSTEVSKILTWLHGRGVHMDSLDDDAIEAALAEIEMPEDCAEVLRIRQLSAAASVKKLYAMRNVMTAAGRLHDLYNFYGAHTGRPTGEGPQPTNLKKFGPDVWRCPKCGHHHAVASGSQCPWCGETFDRAGKRGEWSPEAALDAREVIAWGSLDHLEHFFGRALATISGCLRGMFIAAPGHDLVSSDFSAIEGVVTAALANVPWRLEVFRTHGKIYEMSAAKILGIPFEEMMAHAGYHDLTVPEWWKAKQTGKHHPGRQKPGKIAELALGFGGWIGAWRRFGGQGSDDEVKASILAWRDASAEIPALWGGQRIRVPDGRWVDHRFGLEGTILEALDRPGVEMSVRRLDGTETGITYRYDKGRDILFCFAFGETKLTYHRPRAYAGDEAWRGLSVSYEGYNSNPANGAVGWIRKDIYGGRACENVVQHVARNIQMQAIANCEEAGYPVVLHTYDEIVSEIPHDFGSIDEFEGLMMRMPHFAKEWPIKAAGGWRGREYRKA